MNERKTWISKADLAADQVLNDSLRSIYYIKISLSNLKIGDFDTYKKSYKKSLDLAIKLKDSIKIASNYWDYASIFDQNAMLDSAYYYYKKAHRIYNSINKIEEAGILLLNVAIIQRNLNDYLGSELTTIKAIKTFKKAHSKKLLYNCYNNLGIIYNNLNDYEKALEYHDKALEALPFSSKKAAKKATTLNNKGVIYLNQNDYTLAFKNFKNGLEIDSVYYKNTRLYAMLLDNLAYSKLKLNDYSELPNLFYQSLKIRDSIQHIDGIIMNKIHLSEYYLTLKDTARSYQFAKEANSFAIEKNANEHLLETYDLLAKVDPKNSTKYLRRYIEISDSLLLEERRTRDKFTRIEYETKEVEDKFAEAKLEAEKLGSEATKYKRRNKRVYRILWWIGGSIVVISIVLIVRNYQRTLRNKYEKVVLQQQLLRSQMNPHFLFNTLNTILHATDAKPEKTKQYVLKLSKLLRTTLENSREEFVPLQDEIEAIDNYLNLQSNFSEKFDFIISIADDLETEFTFVPPMLIQPFVENAIIHGITNANIRGLVSLDFTLKVDLVSCTITDNGIGYSKSAQKEKNNLKGHTSISGDIVKERLVIYNKQNSTKASLIIQDVLDENKKAIGTKVILNLPSYEI
ncbi:MAG: histidine kinase [Bacteroidota bacterium]